MGDYLMKLNLLLIISAIYLALVGLGFLLAPAAMQFGTLDTGASNALLANLRGVASTFIGIAVVNWLARNAEPSTALNAIIIANVVGFGLATVIDVYAVLSGAPAIELIPTFINLLFALAFIWAWRTSMSAKTS
jgi:hypothetical protein